jgi:hypothetical protein
LPRETIWHAHYVLRKMHMNCALFDRRLSSLAKGAYLTCLWCVVFSTQWCTRISNQRISYLQTRNK